MGLILVLFAYGDDFMILDITGIELTPGNNGNDCLGNGEQFYNDGTPIECCCDECSYMYCCFVMKDLKDCDECDDLLCPRKNNE